MKNQFYVKALWDDKHKLYYSDSNIRGLNLETESLDEFWDLVDHFAPDLIYCNHFSQKTPKNPSAKVQKDSPLKLAMTFAFRPPPVEDALLKTG